MVISVPTAGPASASTPQGDEQDAQQDCYQPPQDEQANEAKLGITGRGQKHQRGQYQRREAKGCVARHCSAFRCAQ